MWSYRPAFRGGPGPRPAGLVQDGIARQPVAAAGVPGGVVAALPESGPGLAAHTRPVRVTPYRVLIEATANADLLVLASHPRRARHGRGLGPVTEALLRHSRCPVAVVPVPAP